MLFCNCFRQHSYNCGKCMLIHLCLLTFIYSILSNILLFSFCSFLLVIPLPVRLQFKTSNYSFCIFKLVFKRAINRNRLFIKLLMNYGFREAYFEYFESCNFSRENTNIDVSVFMVDIRMISISSKCEYD
jgi:hypothetical protein